MVSKKNKERLRNLAKSTSKLAKAAGRRISASEAASAAGSAKREADGIARNPEPNDREDVELHALVKRNHREVMAALREIDRSVDELAVPMDEAPGAPTAEPAGEFDWTEEMYF